MATAREIVEGLNILAKHNEKGLEGIDVHGEHDIFFAWDKGDPHRIPDEDKTALDLLGWFITNESGEKTWGRHT